MIRITFTESDRLAFGLESASLDYNDESLRVSEVRRLQSATGMNAQQWGEALSNGDVDGLVALVWLALARAGVQVPFAELDFDLAGLKAEKVTEVGPGKGQSTPEVTSH